MKQKIALITIIIALTICVVQGLPRTHRFKPMVNLKQEKLNATEKPVEARKTALFPKNSKKYVVTENPISSTTSSYSYKYFIAKSPLMLKFAPTSKPFLRRDQPRTYQSLMKKIKFVVSTPAPSHSIIKENNLRKYHHLKVNKTNENRNVDDKGNPLNHSINITTTEKTSSLEDMDLPNVSPKNNNTTEVIIIPINLDDLKSNPNVIAEEVKDIVNYMDKVHPHQDKIMTIETSSLQNGDDITTESLFRKPSSRVSTGSTPTKLITEESPSSFEKNNLNEVFPTENALRPHDDFPSAINHNSQNPDDDVGDILYRIPNYDLSKVTKGLSTGNSILNPLEEVVTTAPNFRKELTTESSLLKPADNVTAESFPQKITNDNITDYYYTTKLGDNLTTEKTSPELIIIPVYNNINNIKTNPDEVANEVSDILNQINKLPPHENNETTEKFSSNRRNDFTSESSSPVLTNEVTTESYPSKNLKEVPNVSVLPKLINEVTTESSSSIPTDSYPLTTENISQKSANDKTTEYYTTKLEDIVTTEKAFPELIIIPVNMNEFKSHPNEVANEVKDILNEMNNFRLHQNSTMTENSSPRLANEVITESYQPKPLKEVKEPTEILPSKPIKEITTESSSLKSAIDVTTESIAQKSTNDKTTEYYITKLDDIGTTEKKSPELVIIPVNINEFKSHPNDVANEVKDILNKINKLHPHEINATSGSSSPRLTNEVTNEIVQPNSLNEVTTKSLPPKIMNKVITKSPVDEVTTETVSQIPANNITNELLLPEVVFIPVSVDKLKSHPNIVTDEVEDIINKMKNNSNEKDDTSKIFSSQHAFEDTTKSFSSKPVNKVTTERSTLYFVDEVTKENISSKPAHDVTTETPSPKPENKVISENFPTKLENEVTTQIPVQITTNEVTTESFSSNLENDMTHTPKVEEKLTTENASGETLYIPVNFDDFQSNPVIANEVRDIINYVNKLHPHRDNITEPSSLNTGVIKTNETISPKRVKEKDNTPKLEDNVRTESYSPKLQDNGTNESSSREVVFIPVDMAELKSNPDLIADDINNILQNMDNEVEDYKNYPHKNSSPKFEAIDSAEDHSLKPENSEETYNSSPKPEVNIKTQNTSQKPYENVVTEKTAQPEYVNDKQNLDLILSNFSSEPSIVFEPIVATTLKYPDNDHNDDDDDDDINVGYIINRRNFWNTIHPTQNRNKTNENNLNENKTPRQSDNNTKLNSISDDISDVVYVLKKKEDRKR